MFASWKPVTNSDGSSDVLLRKRPHVFDPVTAKTERPVACSQCRAQKVRCTGERNGEGCRRCQSLGRKCTYAPRRSSNNTLQAEKISRFTNTELRSDPIESSTPTLAEDSGRPVSSAASTNRTAHEWMQESQDSSFANTVTDFSNFPLDPEFTRYPASAIMGNPDVQDERFAPEQIALAVEGVPLFRSPRQRQHPELYSNTTESSGNGWSPGTESRLSQATIAGGNMFPGPAQKQNEINRSAQSSTSTSTGPECQCLRSVVLLLDELELLGEPTDSHHLPIDGILVAHRKSLQQAENMLACTSCTVRVENMMILTILVSRLTDLCCRALSALSSRCVEGTAPPPITAGHAGTATTTSSGTCMAPVATIGSYQLESEMEYVAIARVLLRIGLDRLLGLVSTLQGVGRRLDNETMDRRLGVCRRNIGGQLDGTQTR